MNSVSLWCSCNQLSLCPEKCSVVSFCRNRHPIHLQLFKMGPERLTVEMHQLIVKVWEQEKLPEEWKMGVVHPVYKKGDRLDCSNFQAITVLNAAYKILFQILFCRLAPLATNFVGSYQAGFVGGKATNQLLTLRQILQKCGERQIPAPAPERTTCSSTARRPTTP